MAIVSAEVGQFAERFENDANGQPIYQGWADSNGASASLAVWRIVKYSYNSTTAALERIEWANGDRKFNKIWTDKTNYTYKS